MEPSLREVMQDGMTWPETTLFVTSIVSGLALGIYVTQVPLNEQHEKDHELGEKIEDLRDQLPGLKSAASIVRAHEPSQNAVQQEISDTRTEIATLQAQKNESHPNWEFAAAGITFVSLPALGFFGAITAIRLKRNFQARRKLAAQNPTA